jgi:CRISPR system Cascade subunit CasD
LKPGQPANPGDLQETVLSERYYLSDAFFLAGLESEDEPLLQALDAALAHPVWPLHLGRKAFVPSWPLRFAMADGSGIVNDCLAKALLEAEDPAWSDSVRTKSMTSVSGNRSVKPAFRFVMDASVRTQPSRAFLESSGYVPVLNVSYSDVPLSFHPRRFASREVTTFLHVPV